MFRVPLVTSNTQVNAENFWNSVFLYHSSPHLVNRRILGISQLFFLQIHFKNDMYSVKDILKYSELYSQVSRLKDISPDTLNESVITNIFGQYGGNVKFEVKDLNYVKSSQHDIFLSVRILLPRNLKSRKCAEFVILDKQNNVATFISISESTKIAPSPNFPFDIELDKGNLMKISVDNIETAEEKASEWLADILFPKLMAWTEIRDVTIPVQKSLALIAIDKYCQLYQDLKSKYGENIVKNWPENTDPLKFVYEDVAIATYLLLVWQRTSNNKQRFVDLGCGNGLLVHILSQEGHSGYGIDIRARKIWTMYPETTKLKIQTIIPSSDSLFPNADWIIGNHSDELTPWIPVIAARSSQTCNYFLLPCCSYEFDGKKYQRINSSQSQYREYLDYIKQISETCGFRTEVDRLRIPSTKRICLIGTERQYENFEIVNNQITALINSKCTLNTNSDGKWVDNYEARQTTELVRNCTKLDKSLTENIVDNIVAHLLTQVNVVTTTLGMRWNAGGIVTVPELVKIISREQLKELKNNCGGLQTLLKNHHYIFVVKSGSVQLRMPVINANKCVQQKTRECFFHKKHPDGCTLDADSCSYIHC